MTVLRSYVRGEWVDTVRTTARPVHRRGDRRGSRPGVLGRHRHGGGAGLRPVVRRPGAARADLPPAGGAAQVARARCCASTARSSTRCPPAPARPSATRSSTSTAASACCSATPARAKRELPNDTIVARRRRRAAGQGRHVRRPAHPHPAARGRGPDQRVQLPGLGAAGEVRPGVHRRRAQPGQAGQPDRLPDRPAGRADRRVRAAARRARCSWSAAASATCSTTSSEQDLVGVHRVGRHRAAAARPPGGRRRGRSGSTPRRTR